MDKICECFISDFEKSVRQRNRDYRKIGSELKFPIVNRDGSAASLQKINSLWDFLQYRGWTKDNDPVSGKTTGCRKMGRENHTLASCETGYCKTEFSLACVSDLFELRELFEDIKKLLLDFSKSEDVSFLGYGIQPLSKPGKHLLMKKARTSFWDKIFGANRILPPEDGDDVNIFTINASSHVHLDVFSAEEAISAINVLNGFSGAQIALTGNSNIWRGTIDPDYKCVNEIFWDWWMPEKNRVGVPQKQFENMVEYVNAIGSLKPVYIKRNGKPLLLPAYETFADYYNREKAEAVDIDGNKHTVIPEKSDIGTHNSCYWYNARLTRYHTVENRVNDQQPPEDILCVPALSLGLICNLSEAEKALSQYDWQTLREARIAACKSGLKGQVPSLELRKLAETMVAIAKSGLESRKKGEEVFIIPLENRLQNGKNPADCAEEIFKNGGITALVNQRRLR